MDFIKEKEQIIKEILKNKKVKPGDSIDYAQFLELYVPYQNRMTEIKFAEILEIKYDSYWKIKNIKGRKAKILKSMQVTKEEKQEIVEKIIEKIRSGKIKLGDSINYVQFLELYNPYMDIMNEIKFAEILEVNKGNYQAMKNKRNKNNNTEEYAN